MRSGERSMTGEQLEKMFLEEGYSRVPSNLREFTFYFLKENQGVNVVCTIDFGAGLYVSEEQYFHIKDTIREFFSERGEQNVHILTIILCRSAEKAKVLCEKDRFCWLLDIDADRLMIYENQVPDFYGMKQVLESFLEDLKKNEYRTKMDVSAESTERRRRADKLPWVSIVLVAVNVIVFLVCTFTGDLLYNIGAISVLDLMDGKGTYRMLTSMFLHADAEHLVSNMVVLYYVGEIVEKRIGHLPYAVIYFLSGIAGDVVSMAYELWSGQYVSSVGASGAVFGIEGALLLLVLLNHGRFYTERMTAGRVVFAIAFSLYCGFTSSTINNAAHIGGLMMGMVSMGLLWMASRRIRTHGTGAEVPR